MKPMYMYTPQVPRRRSPGLRAAPAGRALLLHLAHRALHAHAHAARVARAPGCDHDAADGPAL
eukprot:2815374-Prymnesium_polylepis.1